MFKILKGKARHYVGYIVYEKDIHICFVEMKLTEFLLGEKVKLRLKKSIFSVSMTITLHTL